MVIILMGVSGSGKTTIGRSLAGALGWPFYEGDDFHPPANVGKMRRGIPLSDADRWPWLAALRNLVAGLTRRKRSAVLTCSALKHAYRERLLEGIADARLIYLKGDHDLIRGRMEARPNHFMKADLLASQFATLEEPEGVPTFDVAQRPEVIVKQIKAALDL